MLFELVKFDKSVFERLDPSTRTQVIVRTQSKSVILGMIEWFDSETLSGKDVSRFIFVPHSGPYDHWFELREITHYNTIEFTINE